MKIKTLLALHLVSLYVIAQNYTDGLSKYAITGPFFHILTSSTTSFSRISDILGNLIPVKDVNTELSAISGSRLPGNHYFIPFKKEGETAYVKRIC